MHGYLRHLANFARIVEAGSMKSASDALGIAPSGLSDSVKVLEGRLGTALLIRHKAGVTPTTEGERVYASAAGIVDKMNEALGLENNPDLTGGCRISVPTEVAGTCFGSVVHFLRDQHPGLQLKIYAEDDFVDHSRFARDYFLRIAPKFDTSDELRTIWTGAANAILVAPSSLAKNLGSGNLQEVAAKTAIVAAESKKPFGYPLKNPKGRLTFATTLEVSHPATRLALAAQGLGITGCLDIGAASHLQSGALVQILADRFSIPLEIRLMTPHRRKMPADKALVEAIKLIAESTRA